MAANKRNPTQRESALATTARLYLQGKLQWEIAEELGVTRQQVSYDLAILRRRWQREAQVDTEAHIARELARLEETERAAWWSYNALESTERTAPQFLQIVLKCQERRAKLLGLDAPERSELSGSLGIRQVDELSDDELTAIIRAGLVDGGGAGTGLAAPGEEGSAGLHHLHLSALQAGARACADRLLSESGGGGDDSAADDSGAAPARQE